MLEWRQVDFTAGEVRLDPETTKNREGRLFPMTDDLRRLLEEQQREHRRLKVAGFIAPGVFVRMVAKGRNGTQEPRPIQAFTKAWKTACAAAGCPERIPHDLRRTAIGNMIRRGVPNASQCSWQDTRRGLCSSATKIVSDGDLRTAALQLQGLTGPEKGQSGSLSANAESERSECPS